MSWLDDISSSVSDFFGIESDWGRAAIGLGTRLVTVSAVSSLIGNRAQQNEPASTPPAGTSTKITGNQVSLDVNSNNKLSVVYGEAFVGSTLIDAKISTDQKTTWYVYALAEATTGYDYTIGNLVSPTETNILWGDKQVIFGDSDPAKVTKLINGNGDVDTSIADYMYVYLFPNGVDSGINTGGQSAVDLLSSTEIDANERWNSAKYNTNGNPTMENTCFAIIKLVYNQDAGVVGLQQFRALLTSSLDTPGDVIYDYMTNTRYGCGIPTAQIDTDSLTQLNTYSNELITYTPVGGGTATQKRYTIDGAVDTGSTCLSNLQQMVDSCDSWLKWDEIHSKWSVVANRSYTDTTTYDDLFIVGSQNLISGINITPTDLNSTYNVIESHFTNYKIKDNKDFNFVYLDTADKNPNEVTNKLVIEYQLINNSVQAKYLATRRLIQVREDLVINFEMDYSGIQINAGDVIRVQHEAYGWGPYANHLTNPDKLFRVDQVQEEKASDGSLGVRITAFEYNEQVYENIDIQDYNPAANTGLTDPSIVGTPASPTITNVNQESGTFTVNAIVPDVGQIIAIEFWYGPTETIVDNNYKLWDTQFNGTTPVYVAGTPESTDVVGFKPGDYYWKVRALTQTTKSNFSDSTSQSWSPAQPATRKTVSDQTTTTVTYDNTYKLWSNDTRGIVLSIDYTPAETGSDAGGKSTNQINIDASLTNYVAGGSTGELAEVWLATQDWAFPITAISYGSNGYVLGVSTYIYSTGLIAPSDSATPNSYVNNAVTSGFTSNSAASNGSRYVMVGGTGNVVYSNTGYDGWAAATLPSSASTKQLWDVVYNGTKFVAVGGVFGSTTGTGYILTSTDGITWTETLNSTGNILYGVAWNGTEFVAVGSQFWRAFSTDGVTWTYSQIPGGSAYVMDNITWNSTAGLWIAVGANSSNQSKIFTSPDRSTWTARYTGGTHSELFSVSSYSGTYNYMIAVGKAGEIVASTDGISWTKQSTPYTCTFYVSRVLNGNFFLMSDGTEKSLMADATASTLSFKFIDLWETLRVYAFGSSPNSPYDNTIQAPQNQMPNNIPFTTNFNTGSYFKNIPIKYWLVSGDLNNPTTPSTLYASRKSIGLIEYKG